MNARHLVLASLLVLPLGAFRAAAQTADSGPAGTPDALFDGATTRGGVVSGPRSAAGPAAGASATADPDDLDAKQRVLLDGLLARVEVKPGRDPRASALLHQTFVRIVRTPTGAEMTARFIAENARAVVEFGALENSAVTVVNGKAVLRYSGGLTDPSKRPPLVTLNQGYLNTDLAWRGPEMAGTLSHELFGHALERQRADKAGVTDSLSHYRGNEANAGLIGWLVGVEAGGPTDNPHMWNYLRDPEEYHRKLETSMAHYAGTFSVEEMKDPLTALQTRRARVGAARALLHERRDSMDAWRPVIDHFVKIHGMNGMDFSGIVEDIDWVDAFTPDMDKEFENIEHYIDWLATHWRTDRSVELETISREADSPYYAGIGQRLEVLRRRLMDLTANRAPEPSTPPAPGQITWDQFSDMYEQDKKNHPEHWPR